MATETQNLEQELTRKRADYLKRLEGAGQLPTIVSDAWAKAGGAETAALRGQEGQMLKDYVSAGAIQREKYKEVWDPFARDRLAAQGVAQQYAPIADIRSELAMRAEALGIATNAAVGAYNVGTQVAQTDLSFTESAYERALQRENEQTRQRERAQDRAASGASKSASKEEKIVENFKKDLASGMGAKIAIRGEEGDPIKNEKGDYITREAFIKRLQQQYPEIDANDIKTAVYQYYAG